MGTALDVLERYEAAFFGHSGDWKDLVTEDISFEGPLQKASGRTEFVQMSERFLQFHRGRRVLKRFEDGDSVCSICECAVNTPRGTQLTFSYAEWARTRGGRLCGFTIYYDPREFAQAFGMLPEPA